MSNQYVDTLGWTGDDENAHYSEQILPIYQDNPLIEALPPIKTHSQVLTALSQFPDVNPEHRQLPWELRMHLIRDIDRFFQPLPRHGHLYSDIAVMICKGYMARNPLKMGFWKQLDADTDALMAQQPYTRRSEYRKSAMAMAIIGISGIGKSRALEEILALYPQVIHHTEYKAKPFPWDQLVWFKLECPHDASTRSLGLAFFAQIDARLGTNYWHGYARNGRASEAELMQNMARVASIHSLGVLVIDEIQALSKAKSGGAEKMLNFFVQLVNTLGVPIILIGTYKAQELFSQAFRQARRATSQGAVIWQRMQLDDNWKLFSEALWDYQYTQRPVELTPVLGRTLYDLSQGITDIAIKVFILAQVLAVRSGREALTTELLTEAAHVGLPLVQPFLDALRKNDTDALTRMEDIQPINIDDSIAQMLDIYDKNQDDTDQAAPIPAITEDQGLLSLGGVEGSSPEDIYVLLQEQSYLKSVAEEVGLQVPIHTRESGE